MTSMETVLLTAIVMTCTISALSTIYLFIQIVSLHHFLSRTSVALLQMQDVVSWQLSQASTEQNPPSSSSNEEDEAEELDGLRLWTDGDYQLATRVCRILEEFMSTSDLEHTRRLLHLEDSPNSTSTT